MSDVPATAVPVIDAVLAQIQAKVVSALGSTKAAALAPVIAQFGPAFAAMTEAEIWNWIQLAAQGDPFKAYAAVVAKLPAQGIADEWKTVAAQWQSANQQNAVAVQWQRDAQSALLKGLVAVAASMVVL